MNEIKHKNFHIVEKLEAKGGDNERQFILETWNPESDSWLVGCAIGLLCQRSESMEMYLAVSKDPSVGEGQDFFVNFKKDWLFYQQRDVYTYSTGINDLVSYHFLPAESGFLIKQGDPLYIKVGALNLGSEDRAYDAFCNLYYSTANT